MSSRPFDYIKVRDPESGGMKLVLYPNKDWAAQKRAKLKIKLTMVSQEIIHGTYQVMFHGVTGDGRDDTDIGVVPYDPTWKGDFRANLIKKAFTQAKRRVTISLAGRGYLDETEWDDVPGAKKVNVDPETGEITETTRAAAAASVSPPLPSKKDNYANSDKITSGAKVAAAALRQVQDPKGDHANDQELQEIDEQEDFDDTVPFKVPATASEDVKAIVKDLYRCTTKDAWLKYGQKLKKNEAILADMFPPDVAIIRDAYAARGKDFGVTVKPKNGL
jgi:hypothetical protein